MKMFKKITLSLILVMSMGQALALDAINTPWYSSTAIEGHDPVAYFLQNAAIEGSKKHKLEWQGADWHFASAENKALFEANPEKYAPQYGGYCAWAASQNVVAGINPELFTIVDDKLYLNYDKEVQNKWLADTTTHIADGDKNWPGLVSNN